MALLSFTNKVADSANYRVDLMKWIFRNETINWEFKHGEVISPPPSTHHMLNATILALRVFPDGDQVHVGVRCLVAFDGDARPHIGVKVKGLPEQQVHGGMASSNGCLQGSCRRKPWHQWWDESFQKTNSTSRWRNWPFRPILLLSMDSLASGGIIHLPLGPFIAVTFLSSHLIGACR